MSAANFRTTTTTENPVIADMMNSKTEVTIIEMENEDDDDGNGGADYVGDSSAKKSKTSGTEQKYIIPLALKNPTAQPQQSALFQDSSANIDDLKRHILMLQNLTANDQNFQSKFVVFPNLQRNDSVATSTETATRHRSRPSMNSVRTRKTEEKITIIPQVFLQNDQMTNDDNDDGAHEAAAASFRDTLHNRMGSRDYISNEFYPTTMSTTSTTTPTSIRLQRKMERRRRRKNGANKKRNQQRFRQMSTERPSLATKCLQTDCVPSNMNITTTNLTTDTIKTIFSTTNVPIKNISIQQNVSTYDVDDVDNNNRRTDDNDDNRHDKKPAEDKLGSNKKQMKLSRAARSSSSHSSSSNRNQSKDMIFPSSSSSSSSSNQTQINYDENINVNPELCYGVSGLSYGQQKLCAQHTQIMPAISRGARSAIQVFIFFLFLLHILR